MSEATNQVAGDEFLRANEVPDRFPVLGRSTWNAYLAAGTLPSRKIGRMRIVCVADIVSLLKNGPGVGK